MSANAFRREGATALAMRRRPSSARGSNGPPWPRSNGFVTRNGRSSHGPGNSRPSRSAMPTGTRRSSCVRGRQARVCADWDSSRPREGPSTFSSDYGFRASTRRVSWPPSSRRAAVSSRSRPLRPIRLLSSRRQVSSRKPRSRRGPIRLLRSARHRWPGHLRLSGPRSDMSTLGASYPAGSACLPCWKTSSIPGTIRLPLHAGNPTRSTPAMVGAAPRPGVRRAATSRTITWSTAPVAAIARRRGTGFACAASTTGGASMAIPPRCAVAHPWVSPGDWEPHATLSGSATS